MKNIEKEKPFSPTLTARVAGEEHSGMELVTDREISNTVRGGAEEALTATRGILLSKQAKRVEGETELATTLMARDYKGFGNQAMTGVIEWKKKS